MGEITRLLQAAQDGDSAALDRVMGLVYRDLRRIADGRLRARPADGRPPTLEPTELVHEAFLKLIKQRRGFANRSQFFAIASRLMLRVLQDRHRARHRDKREGGMMRVSLSGVVRTQGHAPSADIPAFVEAMEGLGALDGRTADVCRLRVLWGLTVAETAEALQVSVSTVEREWRFGRRWLMAELGVGG